MLGEQRAALALLADLLLHDFPNTDGFVLQWCLGGVRFEKAFAESLVIFAVVPTALLASGMWWAGRRMDARYALRNRCTSNEGDRQGYRGEVAPAEGRADHRAQQLAFGAPREAMRRGAEGKHVQRRARTARRCAPLCREGAAEKSPPFPPSVASRTY